MTIAGIVKLLGRVPRGCG